MAGSPSQLVAISTADTFPALFGSIAGRPNPVVTRMHEAAFAAAGIDARYVSLGTDDLAATLEAARAVGFQGLGISMPFKRGVIRSLDRAGDDVRRIGACNTVQIAAGGLTGHNTDWVGAMAALAEVVEVDSLSCALIVGAGGAARAIAYGLHTAGVAVRVAARRPDAAAQLVGDLSLAGVQRWSLAGLGRHDLVVNATPQSAAHTPLAAAMLDAGEAVFDVGLEEVQTALVSAALRRGKPAIPGWRMLLHQGARQFELYTGRDASLAPMETALLEALADADAGGVR